MSSSETDLFTETFALHLAVALLGPDRIIEHLNDDKRSVPLYWRSKSMISNPSKVLYDLEKEKTSIQIQSSKVLFFDITFDFVKTSQVHSVSTPSSCQVFIKLGFFLLLPSDVDGDEKDSDIHGGHYISTNALNRSQLMSHVESLQLDPESVTPDALAISMADELLRQGPPSIMEEIAGALTAQYTVKNSTNTKPNSTGDKSNTSDKSTLVATDRNNYDCSLNDCDLHVDLPYKSMGNAKGTLLLDFSSGSGSVTKFDKSALRFLSWDISKNPNHCHPLAKNDEPSAISSKQLVEDAFDRWKTRIIAERGNSDTNQIVDKRSQGSPSQPIPERTGSHAASTASVDTSCPSTTSSNKNKKKRKVFRGANVLPSARRKRNKGLVYGTK